MSTEQETPSLSTAGNEGTLSKPPAPSLSTAGNEGTLSKPPAPSLSTAGNEGTLSEPPALGDGADIPDCNERSGIAGGLFTLSDKIQKLLSETTVHGLPQLHNSHG